MQVQVHADQPSPFPDRTAERIGLYQFLLSEATESATDYWLDALQTEGRANKMKDPQFAHLLHQHARRLRKMARRAAARAHRWNRCLSEVSAD